MHFHRTVYRTSKKTMNTVAASAPIKHTERRQ